MFQQKLIASFSSLLYPVFAGVVLFFTPSIDLTTILYIFAVISLSASLLLFQRYRTLSDTPTSMLSSAAQGYVSLIVKAMPIPGTISPGPFELPPVVWFKRLNVTSSEYFMLEDDLGHCTISPKGAEIITPLHDRQQKWFRGIFPGEAVYVLGMISSTSYHRTDAQKRSATLGLLSKWKSDQYSLLNRFDKDGNGKIDSQELLLARNAAEQVVEGELDYEYQQTNTHNIDKPNDFRPLIISSIPIKTLLKKYYRGSLLHLFTWALLSILAVAL